MQILNSKIIGEGQPLLILHGVFGMLDNWQTLGKKFAENYEVHLIDQRNHGKSFHDDELTYDAMADDLYNYVQHHNLKDFLLIGHSMGGKTAMLFAALNPDLLEKLVIVDIGPKAYPVHHQEILDGLKSLDLNVIDSRTEADEQLSKYVEYTSTRQFLLKNLYWVEKGQLGWRFNLDVIEKDIKKVGIALPDNAHFDKPTLFMAGKLSNYILPEDEDMIKRHFPQSEVEQIEGSGHWIHAEKPELFYECVIRFLNR